MKERFILTSFIPIPEIVIKKEILRDELKFLSNRNSLWETFRKTLKTSYIPAEKTFIQGFSLLKWNVGGENLRQSVHHLRLGKQFDMVHRVSLPFIAQKTQTVAKKGSLSQLNEEIRIYPTLFAEYRQILTGSADDLETYSSSYAREYSRECQKIKENLSKALFHNQNEIKADFSSSFTINITPSKIKSATQISRGDYPSFIKVDRQRIDLGTTESASLLFINRVIEGLVLALACRIIVPSLWFHARKLDVLSGHDVRELIEVIFLSLSLEYYLHSRKDTPHILCQHYQRRAFEIVARYFDLFEMERQIKDELKQLLTNYPMTTLLPLLQTSEPLKSLMRNTLKRLTYSRDIQELEPPIRTIVEYLIIEYLKDKEQSEYALGSDHKPMDRWGLRTSNQILNGVKELETKRDIDAKIKQEEIYHQSYSMLLHLMRIGVLRSAQIKKTSANVVYGINPESSTVERIIVEMSQEFQLD